MKSVKFSGPGIVSAISVGFLALWLAITGLMGTAKATPISLTASGVIDSVFQPAVPYLDLGDSYSASLSFDIVPSSFTDAVNAVTNVTGSATINGVSTVFTHFIGLFAQSENGSRVS